MRLTTQMQVEVQTIDTRVYHITEQVLIPMEAEQMKLGASMPKTRDLFVKTQKHWSKHRNIAHATITELNPYKVRLENILCETDVKEQAHSN